MANESVVKFNKNGGPIIVEITSGYSSLGTYILGYAKDGSTDYREFGKEPKRIDDDLMDIFKIPIELNKVKDYFVFIIGKYSPAPGHSQIKVHYEFYQDNELLEVEQPHSNIIEENVTDGSIRRYTHFFEFSPNH